MWKVYLLEFAITLLISIAWVMSIDKMASEHPNYKGEDFLNEDQNETE